MSCEQHTHEKQNSQTATKQYQKAPIKNNFFKGNINNISKA
jgi:hypothetical protein